MATVSGKQSLVAALSKLYRLLVLDRKDIYAIYAFAIFSGLVQLSVPLGIQTIIGFVLAGSVSTSIIILISLVVAGVFFSGFLQIKQMQLTEKVEQKIFVRYAFEITDRLPKMNIQKLDNYYLPELINRFFDTMSLQKGISKLLIDIPAATIQLIFGLILLSFYHPVFIVFGLVLFLVLLLILRFTSIKGMETNLKASDYKYKVAAWLEEIARTIKTFKYSKGTSLHLKETDKLTMGYLHAHTAHFKVLLKQYWSLIAFKVIITAAMLIVGAVLLVDQQLNIGQFVAAEIVILSIIAAVEKFIVSLDKVYDVLTALEKLGKITESETETEGSLSLPLKTQGVAINFNNVHFQYPDGNSVLNNLSIDVKPGQHIAIMGKSGAGKSTVLRLLTGAFKEFTGNVLIDEVPVGNYNLHSLRSQTGILLNAQDIFKASLLDNLTMGNTNISLEEVAALSAITGLSQFVQQQHDGYDTILDPTGKRLPKKVIQTILLMRALLGRHRLLLLEEPIHDIDATYAKQILDFIKNDIDATIIIATSNPVIAGGCDNVYWLQDGTVTASGNWQDIQTQKID
jgi:ABC-type bacteriocin/lantibiotic exporter with double-glycine peptidase domain